MVPIEEGDRKWVDINTKELLLEYKGYDARGGWLSSSIGFNSVYKPYTFDGSCGLTNNEFQKLKKELNFNYVYR